MRAMTNAAAGGDDLAHVDEGAVLEVDAGAVDEDASGVADHPAPEIAGALAIAELLEAGEEVRVVDNETGEDITSVALSQILVDSERTNTSPSPTLISQIFGRGGDALYDALRRAEARLASVGGSGPKGGAP